MELSISDLVYINDAAKSLKHRDFVFINNILIGLDNLNIYICKVILDTNKLTNIPLVGLMFNQKELSKFVKSLTMESSFHIDENISINHFYTSMGAEELNIRIDHNINNFALSRLQETNNMDSQLIVPPEDITGDIEKLFALRKTDGAFYYVYKNNYYMTLFSGLLPLNKSDKVFVNVLDNTPSTFITRFTVKKSKFNLSIYLAYCKVPRFAPQA